MNDDYNHKLMLNETIDGEVLKTIDNTSKDNAKVMWPKIVTYASKKDCLPRVYRYFDKQGTLKRTLTFSEIKDFEGHKIPTIWVMKPTDDSSKMTQIIYKDVSFNVKFKENYFTQKTLTDN